MPFRLTLREEIAISAPPPEVWEAFRRLEAWPAWNPVCVAVRDISASPAPWAVGARFTLVLRMGGVPLTFPVTVASARPPHYVAWTSRRCAVTADRTIAFTPFGDGTLASDTKAFRSPILPLPLFYPRPIVHAMGAASLRALKARVEGERR